MKKISTATAHKVGTFAGHQLTIGLDVGDRSSWYCVLNEAGEVLLERKLAATPKAMKGVSFVRGGTSLMNRSGYSCLSGPLDGELWKRFCAPSDTKQLLTLHDEMRRPSKQ